MTDVLRFDDERGRLAALTAILLALFVVALSSRYEDWSPVVDLLLFGAAAAAVLVPAVTADRHGGPPPGWLSALLVVGFVLAAAALFSLADVLGADTDDVHSSTVTWIAVLLAAGFAWLALRRNSAICTLLAGAAAVVAVVALVDWVFDPGTSTFRYVLVLEAALVGAAGVALFRGRDAAGATGATRDRDRGRHGVVLVVLAGLVVLVVATTFAVDPITPFFGGGGGSDGVGWGWELVILVAGIAIAAFAALTREPGPGYVAAALLFAFAALIAIAEEAFVGWPLVLLLLLLAALAALFRPGGDRDDGPAESTHEVRA